MLTASGGPFRGRTREQLAEVTPAEALDHPNFAMGKVVTTNSATLVNKGLEVIEAHLLFDVPFDSIDVVVHPQQLIHSMVEFTDGAVVAQLGLPTMLVPISLGLGWPDRVPDAETPIDWTRAADWRFEPLDDDGRSLPSPWRARRGCAAAPRRRSTTRPTRCPSRPSTTAGCDSSTSSRQWQRCCGSTTYPRRSSCTVDGVLAADAWARTAAAELIQHREDST